MPDHGGVLTSIHIYPVKGCRGIDLSQSAVEPWGLAGDRRWLLVDEDGRFVSQREQASLARVVISPRPQGIEVTSEGHPPLPVTNPGPDELLKVSVWSSTMLAAAAGPAADAWFSDYLGEPTRLVYLDDPTRRPVDPEYGQDGDVVSFADGYPLLLTSTASLDDLGGWLAAGGDQPVPMSRFRPNAVVTGFEPWAEDRWRRVRIGDVSFRVAKPCGRCVVTTTDQFTGARTSQPLRMLAKKRRFGQSLVFGQNVIPETPGRIQIGDPVEITEYAS
jgi:MOSC domain-containing protein